MAKGESVSVKDAVHKLQLCLLEGIQNENHLFRAGSLICKSDYQDVVTERTIANMCGYPVCRNPLPLERSQTGRYRISLKEHKVYDLHETYMYCSTSCVINSQTFAGSLQEEICSVLNVEKLNEVLRLFDNVCLESRDDLGKNGDFGFSELKIQEKTDVNAEEVSLEEWVGPSNAIEGYVPQRDCSFKTSHLNSHREVSKPEHAKFNKEKGISFNDVDFTSAIITEDRYSISKMSPGPEKTATWDKIVNPKADVSDEEDEDQFRRLGQPSFPPKSTSESKLKGSDGGKNERVIYDKLSLSEVSLGCQNDTGISACDIGKAAQSSASNLKPSLKSSGAKKVTRSVTWADEKSDIACGRDLCEYREMRSRNEDSNSCRELEGSKETFEEFHNKGIQDEDTSIRFASAEVCARALSQAAAAVESGGSDVSDAVSEAGIIILPPPHDMVEVGSLEDTEMLDSEPTPLKWPRKPGILYSDLFESEDSWYDTPPEEFSLTLSPFATMYMTIFAWISSSTLAYIYGHDESFYEDYASINGREYPQKIILADGRSSEIKQTLGGCLARALPGLVADLRLSTPVSRLEQGVGCLLDTMSFVDPLPPFRIKQWQVIVLLFVDALSVCRIPALAPHMLSRRVLLHKVLDGAQIKAEEYEVMKDLIIPLGRVPQFSTQSGG